VAGGGGVTGAGYRTIAGHCGLDRKTVRRYVEAAQAAGLSRDDDVSAVDDALIGMVAEAVRPVRADGHGVAWEQLVGFVCAARSRTSRVCCSTKDFEGVTSFP